MGYIYLASPYLDKEDNVMESRFQAAAKVAALLLKNNIPVYSPIASWHVVACEQGLPRDIDFWFERLNKPMIIKCSELRILTIEGWEQSKGIRLELDYARDCGVKWGLVSLEGHLIPEVL